MDINSNNLEFLKSLSNIIGTLNGDGHLQLKGNRRTVSFYSKNKEEIHDFNNLFERLFKVKGHIYEDKRDNNLRYKLFFCCKKLVIFLKEKETAVGNKTNTPFLIPSWIISGGGVLQREYLIGLFDSEGSIYSEKTGRCRITINQHKWTKLKQNGIHYFNQIKTLLNHFNVNSSPIKIGKGKLRKDGTKSLEFKLCIEKNQFNNFYKNIGFRNKEKQIKLINFK